MPPRFEETGDVEALAGGRAAAGDDGLVAEAGQGARTTLRITPEVVSIAPVVWVAMSPAQAGAAPAWERRMSAGVGSSRRRDQSSTARMSRPARAAACR